MRLRLTIILQDIIVLSTLEIEFFLPLFKSAHSQQCDYSRIYKDDAKSSISNQNCLFATY